MNSKLSQAQKFIIWPLLFTIIALWNIPHTIAGRYICEGLLLIVLIVHKPDWGKFFKANKALLIFFTYLFIQLLFFSTNYQLAFSNFRAEWMHFILFSIIGAGTGLILGRKKASNTLLYLGIAFSIPLYLHLALSVIKGISIGAIPWRYWGINEIHGDFGYPALQASILLLTFYLYQPTKKRAGYLTIGLISICIASPLLAASRGGTGFTIAGILFVFIFFVLLNHTKSINLSKNLFTVLAIIGLGLLTYKVGMVSDPERWGGILSRLSVGLESKPIDVYCKGIQEIERDLAEKGTPITQEVKQLLNSVVDGDGSRMMAARSGLSLMLQHPMGINQSKQAYQTAIIEVCKGNPKIFIAHAHNGWIDTAMAIGIPGALLLLVVMIQYARLGWNALRTSNAATPYGMALFASAIMWMLRGLLDSTFRDQMLEMQAFIFALLLGVILAKTQDSSSKDTN